MTPTDLIALAVASLEYDAECEAQQSHSGSHREDHAARAAQLREAIELVKRVPEIVAENERLKADFVVFCSSVVFVLCLNEMHMAHFEDKIPVCYATTAEALQQLIEEERVPYYQDGTWEGGGHPWGKEFRKGGPLEWYNQPSGTHIAEAYLGQVLVHGIPEVSEFKQTGEKT